MKKFIFWSCLLFFQSQPNLVFAEEEHEAHEQNEEHEGDAHKENKKEEDIVLTEEAIKNFGIKTMKFVQTKKEMELPLSALVTSKDKTQIFFKHEGKFEMKEVNVSKRNGKTFFIDNISIPVSAEIVISGVNFLKVVELSHGEDGSQGHSH
jgi:hypothetical protein